MFIDVSKTTFIGAKICHTTREINRSDENLFIVV